MPSHEILAVLADEVNEAADTIGHHLAGLVATADADTFVEAKEHYGEQLQRIVGVCEALNLDGLQRVCAFVTRNLAMLSLGEVSVERGLLFERWLQLVLGYLKAPRDGVYSREIAELFRRVEWPAPLETAAARALEQALLALDESELDEATAGPARETQARAEDVVLEIPEDVNRKLVDAFLTEGPAQAGEYSELIQRIVRGEGWADEINECRRLIHALKGSANTVGVRGVATLCHHVEDVLEHFADTSLLPSGALAQLLVKVADTLETMFETLLGTSATPPDAQDVLQRVLDCANRMDRGEYDPADTASAASMPDSASANAAPPARASEQVEPKLRVAARVIDDMTRTSGEMTISAGHVRERLQRALSIVAELRERQGALWDKSSDMEGFVGTRGIAAGKRQALVAAGGAIVSGFDALEMDQYSELHTYAHAVTETVADLQILTGRLTDALTAVDAAVAQQSLLNEGLHETLMTARMLPAGTLESRLGRAVRQAAEQCQKQVRLVIEGRDVMLDDQMVNLLIDPLQHMLRNAVAHGIEAAATRAALGKSETGRIDLRFARDGNYLVLTCADDGAGLDLVRIRARALEQGLIGADAVLADADMARLVLRAGFSTAESVTEVSGRGVGMDSVYTNVMKMKGSVDIRSQTGVGTTFILRVPMSLGIAHCLLAPVAHQLFALPTDNLDRIVYDGAQHVRRVADSWRYDDGEINCPAHSLAHVVGAGFAHDSPVDEHHRHVVLMNDIDGKTAIVVESVTSGQDLVIKKLGSFLAGVRGVIGASILGDGSVVPILELTELLRIDQGAAVPHAHLAGRAHTGAAQAEVLVVDDSLSVRTALATLLEEQGFRVRTVRDGIEAIEAIGERRPAAVLADLEMPRMNGLELTSHIRANAAIHDLPVIMVTSRTAKKHRSQARAAGVNDYITKPFQEIDLVTRLRTILNKAA
jgi:chemosensory pili system protein ChpA (sensor histidine kinase/response regulator)